MNVTSAPELGRFAAVGITLWATWIWYCAPGSKPGESIVTVLPSIDTCGVAVSGPFGPITQNVGHATALATTGSENVTTTFAPSGTSSCWSTG